MWAHPARCTHHRHALRGPRSCSLICSSASRTSPCCSSRACNWATCERRSTRVRQKPQHGSHHTICSCIDVSSLYKFIWIHFTNGLNKPCNINSKIIAQPLENISFCGKPALALLFPVLLLFLLPFAIFLVLLILLLIFILTVRAGVKWNVLGTRLKAIVSNRCAMLLNNFTSYKDIDWSSRTL